MPTVIVLDVSLSMAQPILVPETGETFTCLQLAIHGINSLLDYLSLYCKLEFVALVTFSSLYDVVSPFTRDFDTLKSKLAVLEEFDQSRLEPVLSGVNRLVLSEWGSTTPCQVILVTDGSTRRSFNIDTLTKPGSPLPLPFPGKLVVVTVAQPGPPNPILHKLVEMASGDGSVLQLDSPMSPHSLYNLFQKLAETNYSSFSGMLKCGNLVSKVILSPTPMPYTKITDFECQTYSMGNEVEVCGFIEIAQVGSPAAVSRHLVLPHPGSGPKQQPAPPLVKIEPLDSDDEAGPDEGKTPSFCVLLHGALKVENMAALCQVGPEWFGILYSWADSKKKSNLMLTLLEPGNNPVPWLGDLTQLGVPLDSEHPNPEESFPVRPAEKRSYSQNCVVWIRQAGLQSDIQKILRHARKLPEKIQHFYKELNRVRRAAISLGFISLLEGLAAILERECTLLPGGAHPDCALQLTHASGVLRKMYSRDPKYNILPMRTKFNEGD